MINCKGKDGRIRLRRREGGKKANQKEGERVLYQGNDSPKFRVSLQRRWGHCAVLRRRQRWTVTARAHSGSGLNSRVIVDAERRADTVRRWSELVGSRAVVRKNQGGYGFKSAKGLFGYDITTAHLVAQVVWNGSAEEWQECCRKIAKLWGPQLRTVVLQSGVGV
ncbi:hypothetical protein C8J57DRAFT_1232304 [Mycena rebaudengoi]|nr:hypothetical protein C8J57DRAFT_1232304 [Mycena rebaudengoi]